MQAEVSRIVTFWSAVEYSLDYNLIGYRTSIIALACISMACEFNSITFSWRHVEEIMNLVGMECADEDFDACYLIVEAICKTNNIQRLKAVRSTSPTTVADPNVFKGTLRTKRKPENTGNNSTRRLKMKTE